MKEVSEDTWDKRRPIGRSMTLWGGLPRYTKRQYAYGYQEDTTLAVISDWQDIVFSLVLLLMIRKLSFNTVKKIVGLT